MNRFEGKTVIVTGGAGGFGKAISEQFSDEGALVVVSDINGEGAEKVAAGIPRAIGIQTDVTSEEQNKKLVEVAMKEFGKVDIFCANAGVPHVAQKLTDMDVETFDSQFAINVRSVYLAAKYCVPVMKYGSSICVTASVAAAFPRPLTVCYAASKGAVITLTRGLAAEVAPNIRVNAINPVSAPTGFDLSVTGGAGLPEGMNEAIIQGIPMGRRATPKDIADSVLFLSSEEAGFLTGVCLDVDGGRCLG